MLMRILTAVLRTIRNSRRLAIGLAVLLVMVLIALFSPLIVKGIGGSTDPLELAAYERWLVPGPDHLLGTDQFGRDVLAMVVSALSVSLQIGAIAGVISTVAGVIVAFVAGYKGGWIDGILSTFTGILLVIPTFPL